MHITKTDRTLFDGRIYMIFTFNTGHVLHQVQAQCIGKALYVRACHAVGYTPSGNYASQVTTNKLKAIAQDFEQTSTI
jgi:hypothetical protein